MKLLMFLFVFILKGAFDIHTRIKVFWWIILISEDFKQDFTEIPNT